MRAFRPVHVVRRLARALGLIPADGRNFVLELLAKDAVCAEIGVHTGEFSRRILRATKPREVHLVDPWKHEAGDVYRRALYGGGARGGQVEMDERHDAVVARFRSEIRRGRVIVHRGYSTDVLSRFTDASFDWVYIDGNHTYEYVKADLELCFRKVKRGGYVAGDDYTEAGWWRDGVVRAVDEFIAGQPVRVVVMRDRQYVLEKTR